MSFKPLPTQEEAEEWLRFWQPVLSLADWDIAVSFVQRHKLSNPEHTAELWENAENRHAVVKFANDQEEEEFTRPDLVDWEETLVHELLHALFEPSCHSPKMESHQRVMHEQAINATARGFIVLRNQLRAATGKD
jgi:hypothetical protein